MHAKKSSFLKRSVIGALSAAIMTSTGMPARSHAMLAPAGTEEGSAVAGNRVEDIKAIQAALESEIVRKRLAEFKLTPGEIDARLAQLSDSQLHQAALQIRSMNPGGDVGGILVLVLLVLLIVYLVRRI